MNLSPLFAAVLSAGVVLLVGWSLRQRAAPVRDLPLPTSRHERAADVTESSGSGHNESLRRRLIRRRRAAASSRRIRDARSATPASVLRTPPRPLARSPKRDGRRGTRRRQLLPRLPRRAPPVEQLLADWCTSASRAMRAGSSLPDAVGAACRDVPQLESTFGPVTLAQQRGVSLATALGRVHTDDSSTALVVAVIRTCARLGGAAAEPLDRTAAVMHARLAARAERQVHSAQAKLSALVLTFTPFAVLAMLLALEPATRNALTITATWVCLVVGLLLNVTGWFWMRRIISSAESPRVRRWRRGVSTAQLAWPDGIELMVCCLHAGLTPAQLIDEIVNDLPPTLRPAFESVQHRLQRGHRFADALAELPEVIGPEAHSVADSIASADRYGYQLMPVLERLASEAVDSRRRLGEIAARKLPIRLSFPLVATVLPAFVLIALAPAVIGAVSTLRIS